MQKGVITGMHYFYNPSKQFQTIKLSYYTRISKSCAYYLSERRSECTQVGHQSRRDENVSSKVFILHSQVCGSFVPSVLLAS